MIGSIGGRLQVAGCRLAAVFIGSFDLFRPFDKLRVTGEGRLRPIGRRRSREGEVGLDGAAEGPAVETAVVLDVAAGFEPAQGFGDGFVAVAGCFLELARGEAAAGEEQDPEDAGSSAFEIANEVTLFFEGHVGLRQGGKVARWQGAGFFIWDRFWR